MNSGAGLFLYGAPGNGKTTIAKRITHCFGQHIWIPRTITEDGQFIKLFDAACHEAVEDSDDEHDQDGARTIRGGSRFAGRRWWSAAS